MYKRIDLLVEDKSQICNPILNDQSRVTNSRF